MDEKETAGFNSFDNDGSFMESFRKMQEEKKKTEPTTTTSSAPKSVKLPPLMTKRPLTMKMSGLRKKTPALLKPKKLSVFEANSLENEEDTRQTKEPGIPLASSIQVSTKEGNSTTPVPAATGENVPGPSTTTTGQLAGKKRRRNRWSDGPPTASPGEVSVSAREQTASTGNAVVTPVMTSISECHVPPGQQGGGSGAAGGQPQLTPEQLQQIKEQIEMNKMVTEIRAASAQSVLQKKMTNPNQPVYEYDSDEDTEDGTWEHKRRAQEMTQTLEKAKGLTEMAQGKHHIGDFLPPKELDKFIEKAKAIKEGRDPDFSDYRDHKLTESNIGFRMLQKAGWDEGEGLGEKQDGITAPVNQGKTSFDQAGVGAEVPGEVTREDDPFDTYRKRMMLAYRFRPNPLNNPRRPYY